MGSQTSFIWRPGLHFQRRPPEGGNRAPMSLGGAFSHRLTSEDNVNCQYHSLVRVQLLSAHPSWFWPFWLSVLIICSNS